MSNATQSLSQATINATRDLTATNCLLCARDLTDAKSVEIGIGPVCRKRHGFTKEISEAARLEANALVHHLATQVFGLTPDDKLVAADRLFELGLDVLANKLVASAATVAVSRVGAMIYVRSPYDPSSLDAWRAVPGRRWDREAKVNVAPVASGRAVMAVLQRHYSGQIATGPKGPFRIS